MQLEKVSYLNYKCQGMFQTKKVIQFILFN